MPFVVSRVWSPLRRTFLSYGYVIVHPELRRRPIGQSGPHRRIFRSKRINSTVSSWRKSTTVSEDEFVVDLWPSYLPLKVRFFSSDLCQRMAFIHVRLTTVAMLCRNVTVLIFVEKMTLWIAAYWSCSSSDIYIYIACTGPYRLMNIWLDKYPYLKIYNNESSMNKPRRRFRSFFFQWNEITS